MKPLVRLLPILCVLAAGCAHWGRSSDDRYLQLGPPLTKLTAAVESVVRIDNPTTDAKDGELTRLATQEEPVLRKPFVGYKVRAVRVGGHAAVLVCSKDGKLGLLEDLGCTAAMDAQLWKTPVPCEFTLVAERVCPK